MAQHLASPLSPATTATLTMTATRACNTNRRCAHAFVSRVAAAVFATMTLTGMPLIGTALTGMPLTNMPLIGTAVAAPPVLNNLPIRGLRLGGANSFVVEGAELGPRTQLLIPWANATVTLAEGATPQRVTFQVALPDTVPPGIYPVRVATPGGVSNAALIGVDRLEQKPYASKVDSLPVALHGTVGGEQRLRVDFAGKKGESLAVDVESQRLGGGLRPVIRVYDAAGAQLAWSPPRVDLAQDARLETKLPADGRYTVEVHDVLFRAAAPGFLRLKIGAFQFGSMVFPSGVSLGGKSQLEWVGGHLPPGTRTDFPAPPADANASGTFAPPPSTLLYSGHAPRVAISNFPELAELPGTAAAGAAANQPANQPANAAGQPPGQPAASSYGKPPLAISGRLSAPGEEDRLRIDVTPGSRLQFDVVARRQGSPLDGVLTLFGPAGNGLASGDDRPGTADPGVDFTVPEKMDAVIISIRDLQRRGGTDFTYRVVVRDLGRPSATATTDADRWNVPAGGTVLVPFTIARQAYDGPVTLAFPGLPPTIQARGLNVAPGATQGLVSLTVASAVAPAVAPAAEPIAVTGRWIVTGAGGSTPFAEPVLAADSPLFRLRPWGREEMTVAVAEPAAFTADWGPDAVDADQLPLGGKLSRTIVLRRPAPPGNSAAPPPGAVRFRLVTTQPMPKKTVKENNKDVQKDDLDRALRLEGEPMTAALAVGAQADQALAVLVPADLPAGPWSFAVVAELLGPDNKTVVATAATPVRTLPTVKP